MKQRNRINQSNKEAGRVSGSDDHRGRVKSDFPKHTLDEALRVAKAIADKNAGQPLPPTETAIALGISPGSSEFRTLLSSSIKYGLTSGSFNSEKVSLEHGGRNIVEPRSPEDEHKALEEAALAPPTFRAIYDYFRGKKLPDDVFFQNTLVREFGVPREHSKKCATVFVKNVERVGLVRAANTGKWLSTEAHVHRGAKQLPTNGTAVDPENVDAAIEPDEEIRTAGAPEHVAAGAKDARLKRVFITHGKNMAFIAPIKDLLSFGQLEPIVSMERESVAQPVPDKVMKDMRTCGAAIIHIEDELKLVDQHAKEHVMLNSNVLIEIGAAMALYGRRYIFLVKEGVELPSNLLGLYEVRYAGEKLDGEVTIRLLKAINEMKKESLPDSALQD
jgi:predicted nucleotide-binding protein